MYNIGYLIIFLKNFYKKLKRGEKKGVPQSELFSSKALFFVRNRIYFQRFKSEKETYL